MDLYLLKKKSVVVKICLIKKYLEMFCCLLDLVLVFGMVWFWLSWFGLLYGKCVFVFRDFFFLVFYVFFLMKIFFWIKERIFVRDIEEVKFFYFENRERERCKIF